MMPVAYPAQPPRLLEPARESIRYKHYSLKTEEAYVHWASFFVRRQGAPGGDAATARDGHERGADGALCG